MVAKKGTARRKAARASKRALRATVAVTAKLGAIATTRVARPGSLLTRAAPSGQERSITPDMHEIGHE